MALCEGTVLLAVHIITWTEVTLCFLAGSSWQRPVLSKYPRGRHICAFIPLSIPGDGWEIAQLPTNDQFGALGACFHHSFIKLLNMISRKPVDYGSP